MMAIKSSTNTVTIYSTEKSYTVTQQFHWFLAEVLLILENLKGDTSSVAAVGDAGNVMNVITVLCGLCGELIESSS